MPETSSSVLAIGAHAGDMEISAGPVLARASRMGRRVHLLHLTPGEKGHPRRSAGEYGLQKRREAVEAAAILGGEPHLLDYRDGELPDDEQARLAVAVWIRRLRPDAVITHPRGSMHRDHARTHRIVEDALFYAAVAAFDLEGLEPARVRRVYFAENWEDREGFEPFHFVPVEEDIGTWEKAACAYELFRGGVSRFPYLEYYRALYRVRGAESWCGWACAFGVAPGARRTVGEICP